MNYEQIHSLFKQRYNQSSWKQFLTEAFVKTRLLSKPEILPGIDANVASQVQKLGFITLDENGIERQIAVYEVILAEGIILERNRVGLRNLLRKYWKDIDAAFIVYHLPGVPNWRFTYVSELAGYNPEGDFVKIKTEPKRYTYVLGEGESTRTAAERFTTITNKGSKTTLDDVKEAFSVEKLSKAFFDEYKKHYDIVCDFMISKPTIRQTIFNGDEKGIRDFNKKFLGRIVFLYFIQKKGWLGVPLKEDWGNGDFNFLTKQYENFRNKDLFYKDFLSILFFETLNTKRKDDVFNFDNAQFILKNTSLVKIPFLSGGLFDEDDKKQRGIIFPANLIKSLFDFFNQYNFTIYEDSPNDHTVAVDPEMLGHIFENLLEDNKDKGAFYTPKEIVHYMCQESLIVYLTSWFENKGYQVLGYIGFDKPDQPKLFSVNEGRKGQLIIEADTKGIGKQIDRLLIEKLLKKKLDDDDKKLIKKHSAEFHIALDTVKICDPAIGSGAFPMGLLHEIFTAKQTLHTFEHGNTKTFNASAVKLNIIQNSIYGVDIEKGAVDIARLRFWLSLIVDEEKPQALPNLDYKIVVGNSLVSKLGDDIIDIDWTLKEGEGFQANIFGSGDLQANKAKILKKISQEQKEFFKPNSDKKKLAADIRKLKIDLLITQLELMVNTKGIEKKPTATGKTKAKQTEIYLQTISWKNSIKDLEKLKNKPGLPLHFFDWKLDFPEVMNEQVTTNFGFDIVIGNPPYGATLSEIEKDIFKIYFSDVHMRTPDTFNYFTSQALRLSKTKGILSYIVPNNLLFQSEYEKTRGLLIRDNRLIYAINLGDGVFESATVPSCIFLSQKIKNTNYSEFSFADLRNLKTSKININNYLKNQKVAQILEVPAFVFGVSNVDFNIIKKVANKSVTINDIALEVASGISTGGDKIFRISKKVVSGLKLEKELLRPVLVGGDIDKYIINDAKHFLIYSYKKSNTNKFENIYSYLKPFKEKLSQKRETKNGTLPWWCLHWHRYPELFQGTKIILRQTSDSIRATIDDNDYYVLNSILVFKLYENINYDYKFVLAVLNSKLTQFAYKNFTQEEGRTFAEVKPKNVRKLFIPKSERKIQNVFNRIVVKILDEKSEGKDTTALEQQIDNLVYKLYELTYDEVKVIDPAFSLSKKEYEAIKLE